MHNSQEICQAIMAALPENTSQDWNKPSKAQCYTPPAHLKALPLNTPVVVGARGMGKTFWTKALSNPELRQMLGHQLPELENLEIHIGHHQYIPNNQHYPDKNTFAQLLKNSFEAKDVWNAVICRWLEAALGSPVDGEKWADTCTRVQQDPEDHARLKERASAHFQAQGKKALIVFDALDHTSDHWDTLDHILRDLLQLVLNLRAYPALHAKVFLRKDQLTRPKTTQFTDASKLMATQAELTWQMHDLHGLLWQLLCNAQGKHGQILRTLYEKACGNPPKLVDEVYVLDDRAKRDEPTHTQRALFEQLAGPFMGKDKRRGVPYVWSVSHLTDGHGSVSPRSFLAAIRAAAEDSLERYPDNAYALHYESIKRGVQKASSIRVKEISEDFAWIEEVFKPLKGITVPCELGTMDDAWSARFPNGLHQDLKGQSLLPEQTNPKDWAGVREKLQQMGLVDIRKDGRINVPDLYQVAFGLRRRGGVKPIK